MKKILMFLGLLVAPALCYAGTTYYFDVTGNLSVEVGGDTMTVRGNYDSTDFSLSGSSLTITYDGHNHSTFTIAGNWPIGRIVGGDSLLTGTTQHAGDVTGTYDNMVVGNNSHNHTDSTVSISTAGINATGAGNYLKRDNTWETPAGAGDMTQAVYDTDADNIVDNSEQVGGKTTTYLLTPSSMLPGTFPSTVGVSSITTGNYFNNVAVSSANYATNVANDAITTYKIKNGEILNEDLNSNASIYISKLATTGNLGAEVVISSIGVGAVVPSVVAAGTYSNITLPFSNLVGYSTLVTPTTSVFTLAGASSLITNTSSYLALVGGSSLVTPTTSVYSLAGASTIVTPSTSVFTLAGASTLATPTTNVFAFANASSLITNTTVQTFVISIDSATPAYLGSIDLDTKSFNYAITISSIVARCNSGTVTGVALNWASDTAFDTTETAISSNTINVGASNLGWALFNDNTIPANSAIILKSTGTTGSPSKFWVRVWYTKD